MYESAGPEQSARGATRSFVRLQRRTRHRPVQAATLMPAATDAFTVLPLEGKGLGAVANRDISIGEVLIREQPLLRLTPDGNGRYDGKYYQDRDEARAGLLSLAQDVGGARGDTADAMTKVIETNGIVLDGGASSVTFLTVSRLNHDCDPNCRLYWDEGREEGSINAIKSIAAGDELSINYGAHSSRLDDRQRHLLSKFGFRCRCERCLQQKLEVVQRQEARRAKEQRKSAQSLAKQRLAETERLQRLALVATCWPPIDNLDVRWQYTCALRASPVPIHGAEDGPNGVRTGRRAMCVRCVRPSRVCVCDALPNPRLQPSVPILVLQHKSEAARKLGSGSLLGLSIDAARVQTVVGRTLGQARRSAAWTQYEAVEGRTPLLLYPRADATSVSSIRARMAPPSGERFFLVALDGTWGEAKEMNSREAGDAESSPLECLALEPSEEGCVPLFAGCRKPVGPSCLCTLEAVALALKLLEPSRLAGEVLFEALRKPMLRMVQHQATLTAGREVHRTDRPGYIRGLTEAATAAAATAMSTGTA